MAKSIVAEVTSELWGLAVAEGVLAVLFGIAALFWPGATVVLIVVLFAIFTLVWGVIELVKSLLSIGVRSTWWIELIFSLLVIGLGVYLIRNPAVSVLTLLILAGLTFIVRGAVDLIEGFFSQDPFIKETRLLRIVAGIIGVIAGIIVFRQPVASGLAFVWIIGLYAILEGVFTITVAVKVRNSLAK